MLGYNKRVCQWEGHISSTRLWRAFPWQRVAFCTVAWASGSGTDRRVRAVIPPWSRMRVIRRSRLPLSLWLETYAGPSTCGSGLTPYTTHHTHKHTHTHTHTPCGLPSAACPHAESPAVASERLLEGRERDSKKEGRRERESGGHSKRGNI